MKQSAIWWNYDYTLTLVVIKKVFLVSKSYIKGHIQIKYEFVLKWPIYYANIASGFIFKFFSIETILALNSSSLFTNSSYSSYQLFLLFHQLLPSLHQLLALQLPTPEFRTSW